MNANLDPLLPLIILIEKSLGLILLTVYPTRVTRYFNQSATFRSKPVLITDLSLFQPRLSSGSKNTTL